MPEIVRFCPNEIGQRQFRHNHIARLVAERISCVEPFALRLWTRRELHVVAPQLITAKHFRVQLPSRRHKATANIV